MGCAERADDGEFVLDKQGRLEFHYTNAQGDTYDGPGWDRDTERSEVATLAMIEGFSLSHDTNKKVSPLRRKAHAAMQAAFIAIAKGARVLRDVC